MQPVLAKDVVIQFMKYGEFAVYACASEVFIDFEMETKSVRTINDGNWRKERGQVKGYNINLSGVVIMDEEDLPAAFDIYEYFTDMVPIEYRIIFQSESGALRLFEGFALPKSIHAGGGSEGFATFDTVLVGDGAPTFRDSINPCPVEITSAEVITVDDQNALQINSVTGGTVLRYDYQIDGGGRQTAFTDGNLPAVFIFGNGEGEPDSEHTLTVIPVCDNGYDGEPFDIQFTNKAEPCIDVTIIGSPKLPDGQVGILYSYQFRLLGTEPFNLTINDRPAWMNIFISGDTVTFSGVPDEEGTNIEVDITITNCSSGSANFSDTLDIEEEPVLLQTIGWLFSESGANGTLFISRNGVPIVSQDTPGIGSFNAEPGDEIIAIVSASGSNTRQLIVESFVDGIIYSDLDNTQNLQFTWIVQSGHNYSVTGNVYFG